MSVRTRVMTGAPLASLTSGSSYKSTFALRLALAQIIFGRAWRRPRGRAERIEILIRHRDDAAVRTHLDHVEALRRILEHPMLAFELGGNALDTALHAERLAAADAAERLFLLEHARACGHGAEVELRPQGDDLLGAGRLAQPALHAGVLGEAKQRTFLIVGECPGRAGGDAREAERAPFHVEPDRAERGSFRRRAVVGRGRWHVMLLAPREAGHIAFLADRGEPR